MSYKITLIPGDGIGPEVTKATKKVLDSIDLAIDWEIVNAGEKVYQETGVLIPNPVFESIENNKVVLKGPITTPIGSGFRSINVLLRKKYDLYANIRPIKALKENSLDLTIFRENTEGLYIGEEQMVDEFTAEAIKRITRKGSLRIAKAAFEYTKKNNIDKVTVVHKANILKLTDGLFLNTVREVAKDYDIELEEVIIDAMCMQLVMYPTKFKVIVTTNLYGDILSDLGAGLVGGLGLTPGANIGDEIAIFEAVHGSGPDIAGLGVANPIAMIRSAIMMLEYLDENKKAKQLETAVNKVIQEAHVLTKDLGGTASTEAVSNEIIRVYKGIQNG
ncbi:MAG: isocitrate/isopropylmalate dehydrogenase family protein [Sphaerochaetaceae bacterium]|nr:isocitrate/isopropylmalate dehydrogenase family protein [Sphaerochaetaceae bacterium]